MSIVSRITQVHNPTQLYKLEQERTGMLNLSLPQLASVPCHWNKSPRQSFGWSRKEKLYCFARQRGTHQANALKTVCPHLEGGSEEFREGMISLWTFFWLVVREVGVSITSLPAPACLRSTSFGQHTSLIVHFHHLEGFSVSAKHLKDVVCIPWWRTRTLPLGCTVSYCFALVSISPPLAD